MIFRAAQTRLARPTAQAGSAAAAASSSSTPAPAPLLQFPAFHPAPFQQDKFLSIKTRSLESYTKLRGDVLQRCAELTSQLQRRQERHVSGAQAEPVLTLNRDAPLTSSTASPPALPDLPSLPLTPHQAEELLLLSKKVESLSQFQGLVLSDELVWRMFHLCVQCGAPQQAIETWLQGHILNEQRGPPFPLFVIEDLAALLRSCVLPRLPESGASLACRSCFVPSSAPGDELGQQGVAIEDGLLGAQRYLLLQRAPHTAVAEEEDDDGDEAGPTAQLYANHLVQHLVWPVWRSLEAMELTLGVLTRAASAADDAEEEEERGDASVSDRARWPPDALAQTRAVQAALMSVTPLHSFEPASVAERLAHTRGGRGEKSAEEAAGSGKTSSGRSRLLLSTHSPAFLTEVDAVVAPLRALLDLWLVVAQCASEAKDTSLLVAVQRTVCAAFLTAATASSETSPQQQVGGPLYALNEAAWCRYAPASHGLAALSEDAEVQAAELVRGFVGGALSVLQYGRLCAEQEAALWQLHDVSAFVFGGAALLHQWRNPPSPSVNGFVDNTERRLQALTETTWQQQTSEERASDLLCNVLPHALCATFHKSRDEPLDAVMTESVRAFLFTALDGAAVGNDASAASVFADAALYVGLATCDDALLQRATAAASMPETEAALVRLNAQVLQAYRSAIAPPADPEAAHNGEMGAATSSTAADTTTRLQQQLRALTSRDSASTSQLLEGSLQTLILDVARQQADCVAAYVRAIYAADGREAEADEEHNTNDDTTAGNAHHYSTAEETRQVAAQQGWTVLQAQSTQNITAAVEHVAALLTAAEGANADCLSPSAMGSVAVLARVGMYLEEVQSSSSGSTTTGDAVGEANTVTLRSSLDGIMSRLTADSCRLLQQAGPATTAVVGTWVQWVLVALMTRKDWAGVLRVLRAMDGLASGAAAASSPLLCSASVDPVVFAALYARALEDGAVGVCAFLRPRREALFF